jgi:uncharacterized membrane protein YqgA involved in biofilm formation
MVGTMLNVAGILIGGALGLTRRRPLSPASESYFKVALAAFTVFYGLRLTWLNLSGTWLQICKQLLILLIALSLGKIVGRLVGLQKLSNRLGRRARDRILAARPGAPGQFNEGFLACTALFCAAPLGILGAVAEGLTRSDFFYPLAVKAVMDGLATMGFVSLFGWGVMLSALPVLAFQGTLSMACAQGLEPFLHSHGLVESVNAVGGVLVFCVALVMLELKRVELADYLPSLLVAPLLTWLFR